MEITKKQIILTWSFCLCGLLIVPFTFFVWIPHRILAGNNWAFSFDIGGLRFLGWLPMIIGLAIVVWCVLSFAIFGKGTPSPLIPTQRLVARGLYRFVRNPMYLGWLMVLGGEALLFQSIPLVKYLVGTFAFFYFFILFYEEPSLAAKFGESYEHYRRAVRRWIPRLKPYQPLNH